MTGTAEHPGDPSAGQPVPTRAPEDELRARIRELEQTLQEREDLLAVVAHELRNPMHALLLHISAALAIARREQSGDHIRRLERIKHIVDRYVKRATMLLDVCRLSARGFALSLEQLDLAAIAREVVESYAAEAAFHRSSIVLEASEPLEGRWDRMAMEQVLSNLIANAIRYGASAPVTVRLGSEPGGWVRIEVHDLGIGLSSHDQERIFMRLAQAWAPLHRRAGSGVGLWLVRTLLNLHGGDISVSSALGQGSTFTARVPRDAASQANGRE